MFTLSFFFVDLRMRLFNFSLLLVQTRLLASPVLNRRYDSMMEHSGFCEIQNLELGLIMSQTAHKITATP